MNTEGTCSFNVAKTIFQDRKFLKRHCISVTLFLSYTKAGKLTTDRTMGRGGRAGDAHAGLLSTKEPMGTVQRCDQLLLLDSQVSLAVLQP